MGINKVLSKYPIMSFKTKKSVIPIGTSFNEFTKINNLLLSAISFFFYLSSSKVENINFILELWVFKKIGRLTDREAWEECEWGNSSLTATALSCFFIYLKTTFRRSIKYIYQLMRIHQSFIYSKKYIGKLFPWKWGVKPPSIS